MTQLSDEIVLTVRDVERLIQIADAAGVKQGIDIVGPHDTVTVERVRAALEEAKGDIPTLR